MRGLFPIGKTATSTGSTLLGTGGTNTIATVNLPSHSHASTAVLTSGTVTITDPGHSHTTNHLLQALEFADGSNDSAETFNLNSTESTDTASTGITASVGTGITMTNASTGSGTAYFQPFIAVNYIIKHD
jgi:microcystin-dependent protein